MVYAVNDKRPIGLLLNRRWRCREGGCDQHIHICELAFNIAEDIGASPQRVP